MAGSGAALDPLFWVVPGAVDRLYQRVVFENVLSGNTNKNTDISTDISSDTNTNISTNISSDIST